MNELNRNLAPLHPGVHLQEEINFLGLTKTKTAGLLGVSRQYLDRILKGNASITAPVAAHIAVAFGTTDKIWMALQADYDLWNYTNEHQSELAQIECVA